MEIKANANMTENCFMLVSFVSSSCHTPHFLNASFSCPAWSKKTEREREMKSLGGHASQISIRTAMHGMNMDEMSCQKNTKE